jgi:hypothetical protein
LETAARMIAVGDPWHLLFPPRARMVARDRFIGGRRLGISCRRNPEPPRPSGLLGFSASMPCLPPSG